MAVRFAASRQLLRNRIFVASINSSAQRDSLGIKKRR